MKTIEKLILLEKEATKFGFTWENSSQIMHQLESELAEIEVHLSDGDQDKLQEEIGDLLHAAFTLCLFTHFDPIITLKNSINKFEKRLEITKKLVLKEGLDSLQGSSFSDKMKFWDKAKKLAR